MAAWTPVVGGDERIRFPTPLFVLAIDRTGEQATSIETQYIRRLVADSALRRKVNLLFDIREHDKRAPKKEASSEEAEGESEEGEATSSSSASEEDIHD